MGVRSIIPIADFEQPELAPYRTMRKQIDHARERLFVAEGEKVVRRLIESPLEVVSVLLPSKWLATYCSLLENRDAPVTIFTAEKPVLEQLTGYTMYQGVLAVGRIPQSPALPDILSNTPRPRFFAASDGLSSADNLGVLVRNCSAFGVQAFLSGLTSSSPYLRRAVRSSMGTVFQLPVLEHCDLRKVLPQLKEAGVRCIAAHPGGQKTVAQIDFTPDCCVVFGSEGDGISPAVLELCDETASIPMHRNVDSLNVGSAGAVFLYEVSRQRNRIPSQV